MTARRGPKIDPLHGPLLLRRTVLLDELALTQLQVIGEGNLSKGVRIAARDAYAKYQATPDVMIGGRSEGKDT